MLLVIDIGNTNTSLGVFEGNDLVHTFALSSDIKKTDDEYGISLLAILNHKNITSKIKGAIVSSVVPQLCEIYKSAIKKYLDIEAISLSYKSKMPIKLNLANNKEIGADRIANAVAATVKYQLPAIVIDFGTATTFDIVDKNANFIGGLIAPGLKIQAKSLSQFTSKLPKLKIEAPSNAIGKDTISAMLSGIVLGHSCMIDGMIKKCEKELGQKATVIATGGYSNVLFENSEINYIDKDLTLFGLKELYKLNKE
ncbi:type III pantothenate kinase [bacterium]|nr:type III pantothenate kinase [bacterium]MBQ9149897.1 type III pantothenate kinase [bacterium]